MITVITCSKNPHPNSIQEHNIAKTIGVPYQYLLIDCRDFKSYAQAANSGIAQTEGTVTVFIPDDAYFMKLNWGATLLQKFTDPSVAAVGVAGTQYLAAESASLTAAGRPFIKGKVVYHLQNGDFFAAVFSPESGDFEVVGCDSVFLAVRTELFHKAWFDEQTFDGEHLAELDLCMQLRYYGRIIVTSEIVIKRRSQVNFDQVWQEYNRRFSTKWASELPARCVEGTPDPATFIASHCVNLKGKAPTAIIC